MHILLLLLILAVPLCNAQDAISFAQAGLTKEPFDVNKSVDYNIPVNNNINYNMLYIVNLEVGFDTDYPDVFKRFDEQSINVNPHSTAYATFNVNFRSPELFKGDFKTWALNKNDTSNWDRAWYRATIIPLSGKSVTLENYEGHPQLCKPLFEFRRPMVNPTQGSSRDQYSYEVTAFGSYVDNISLLVGPSQMGPWTDLGSIEYTTPNTLQTLIWDNKTLGFDFNIAYFKFAGRKSSEIVQGPFWPIAIEYRNISVSPENGTSDTPFTYSIDVNSSKTVDVELNVLDVSSGNYNSVGRLAYKNISNWETLTWNDIRPSSATDANGESNYFFSFYYKDAEVPITTTYKDTGRYYPGPSLAPVALKNWTVEPKNGTIFTPYTYSVQVESREPHFDVKLQTSPPGSDMWTDKGTVAYNGDNNTLIWEGISFDPSFAEAIGNGRYRFVVGDSDLGEFMGPNIDVAFKNVTYVSIPNTPRFDYEVTVKSLEPDLKIELVYTNDGLVWTRSNLTQEYKSDTQEWKELVWKDQPWHKTVRFDVVRT